MASISSALTPSLASRSLGFTTLSARIFCHASILTPSEMPPPPGLALAGRELIFVAQRTWLSPSPRGKFLNSLRSRAIFTVPIVQICQNVLSLRENKAVILEHGDIVLS